MIDCEKCREMISCLLDGELSQAEQSFVREHIAACPECRSVYDAFSAVSAQLHEEEPLPDGLHEKIMSGIKARPKKKTGIVWIKYLSVAACLALVIFAGVKSGMLSPAEHKTDSNDLYVAKSLPVLDGRFTGQSGEESDGNTQEQSAKTSVTLEETDAEKLLALIEPADGAEEYEPMAEADYAVSLGGDVGVVLIYIDGDSVYADRGEGALSAPCTADEIRDLLDACAGE
jgi:predicted anti-sigma-YlaC factor YlaD